MKINRIEVYKAIDTERDYQEHMILDVSRPDMIENLHVGDTLVAIQYNLNNAINMWYKGATPHTDTLIFLRKIAALCVQAGEKYGMPMRDKL